MAFPEDRARSHGETLEETPNPAGRSATRNRSPTARDRPWLERSRPRPKRNRPPSERSRLRSSAIAFGANASFGNRAESQRRIFCSRRARHVPLYCKTAPGWRNGRRVGLKNRYRKVCGFESHPGHHFFAGNRTAINSPNNLRCYFHIRVFADGRLLRPDAPGAHAATASSRAEVAIRCEQRPRTTLASIARERQPQAVRAETKKPPPRVQTREREPLRAVSATSAYSANSFSPLNTARASATE